MRFIVDAQLPPALARGIRGENWLPGQAWKWSSSKRLLCSRFINPVARLEGQSPSVTPNRQHPARCGSSDAYTRTEVLNGDLEEAFRHPQVEVAIGFLATGNSGSEIFHLPPRSRTMSFSYGNNCLGCLRLKNRRERDYFQDGRMHQLDAKKLSLADANGPRLLRD